jgi:hypothetical protein
MTIYIIQNPPMLGALKDKKTNSIARVLVGNHGPATIQAAKAIAPRPRSSQSKILKMALTLAHTGGI